MNKKDNIRKWAFRMFIEKGFSDVSVNDIISSMGITKGCFYYYFESKQDLIYHVFDYYMGSYFDNIIADCKKSSKYPKEMLLDLCTKLLSYDEYIENILYEEKVSYEQFYYLLIEGSKKFDFILAHRQHFFTRMVELISAALEEGKKLNIVREDIDSKTTALKILTNNEGLALYHYFYEEKELKKAAEERLNDLWQLIAA